MPVQTADIIDLQAFRQSRNKPAPGGQNAAGKASFVMQPVLMWVPFWGFVPVMAMGVAGYGA
ncbi:hypothetical protein ACO34A_27090 (plasmid) [Rhizobium sp. ACO-34A]|nr:hypothetical protein [Rhizobium sp. ACO-34A]ATN37437.1 hypothetical protein ACO34A_27090 [Rhizobium sp. ACO-34A]